MINFLITALAVIITNFYSLSYTDTNGNSHAMSAYAGKKILIVNIATNSPMSSQIGQLQQLHQQYGDSLIIIAFPSNSFGNEKPQRLRHPAILPNTIRRHFQHRTEKRGNGFANECGVQLALQPQRERATKPGRKRRFL